MSQFMFSFNTQPESMADIFFESPFEGFDTQALGTRDDSSKKDVSTEETGKDTITELSSVYPVDELTSKSEYIARVFSISENVHLAHLYL